MLPSMMERSTDADDWAACIYFKHRRAPPPLFFFKRAPVCMARRLRKKCKCLKVASFQNAQHRLQGSLVNHLDNKIALNVAILGGGGGSQMLCNSLIFDKEQVKSDSGGSVTAKVHSG